MSIAQDHASETAKLPEVRQLSHLIDGAWVPSASGETFERLSPATNRLVSVAAKGNQEDTERAIRAARTSFDAGVWAHKSGQERAALLNRVADLIDERCAEIALFEVLESGKPIAQAEGEIEGAANIWRYAATLAWNIRGQSQNALGEDMLGIVLKEPIGVAAMVTPWNFPFLIISQKLPFALAAGCSCVVKPSEMTSTTTVMLGEMLVEAGLPKGVVNIVLGFGDPVGSALSSHKDVDLISFTGSTSVGKMIMKAASGTLKKLSMELGGKNPQVIFKDANLDEAADAIAFGVYFNAGECCNSGSRIIVHKDIVKPLLEKVIELSKKVRFGDPMDRDTQVGALISTQHQEKIDTYVKQAIQDGATIALGGNKQQIDGLDGAFYEPTIVTDVTNDMAIAHEEVFGPVLSVLTFETFDEAISLVNDADYGLSAGVWSEDVHTCLRFARKAQAGTIWTNTWMDGYPELPFGGVKQSGLGRELGTNAIEEYLECKTVQMRVGHTRSKWV